MAVKTLLSADSLDDWASFRDEVLLVPCPAPDGDAIREMVAAALDAPHGFPPLAEALTPDDTVAIALGPGVAAREAVVAGVIESLLRCGLSRERITVVAANPHDAQRLRDTQPGLEVAIESHDASDEDTLCFVGLTADDRQLRLNRTLFDADVLLPVAATKSGAGEGGGAFEGVFPEFCDQKTIERFHRVRSVVAAEARGGDHAKVRRRLVNEAVWMIGAPLVVSVVPGPLGNAAGVVAGAPDTAAEQADALYRKTWTVSMSEPTDLVVAALGGESSLHTWGDIGRALQACDRIATPGAVIVVWSELDASVGESLSLLLDSEDFDRVAPTLSEQAGEEALAAWRLAQALDRGPVFFKSKLPEATVERMGMASLSDSDQLARIVKQHGACTLLSEAQHIWFGSEDDA